MEGWGGLVLMVNGEPKLKLRKNDSFGRVMFQGKEMLYANKKLSKRESEERLGLESILYNCFV